MAEATVQSEQPAGSPPQRGKPRHWRLATAIGVITLVLAALIAVWIYYFFPGQVGPAQPIPFSHRFHVSTKQISCLMCHTGVTDTPRAGIPPLETCMLCHQHIIVTYPPIQDLRAHYYGGKPVEWVRVNTLPDFVYFTHERHIRVGFDCGQCHGEVSGMDRVNQVKPFSMNFCIQCHRDHNFSHDCFICHR